MNWSKLADESWTNAQTDYHTAMRREWLVAMILAKKTATWRNLQIEQDTRDKLVAGWAIYAAIRAQDARSARELRNRYNYRRFMEMGRLWVQWEFTVEQAIDHLKSELSTRAMVMQIIGAHDPRPEWFRHSVGAYHTISKLITDLDTDAEIIAWAKQGKKLFERKGIK
jgi:hypothetical protein